MNWLLPFLCGLGAGILSAWGVGGGTLLLLVMTLFLGVDQATAQGINLLRSDKNAYRLCNEQILL